MYHATDKHMVLIKVGSNDFTEEELELETKLTKCYAMRDLLPYVHKKKKRHLLRDEAFDTTFVQHIEKNCNTGIISIDCGEYVVHVMEEDTLLNTNVLLLEYESVSVDKIRIDIHPHARVVIEYAYKTEFFVTSHFGLCEEPECPFCNAGLLKNTIIEDDEDTLELLIHEYLTANNL